MRTDRLRTVGIRSVKPIKKNVDYYLYTVKQLYNKGEYEEALAGINALCTFDTSFRVELVPIKEKCKHVAGLVVSFEDKRHWENQSVLRRWGWLNKIKITLGLAAFCVLSYLIGNVPPSEAVDAVLRNPILFITAVLLVLLTTLLYLFMK